MHVYSFEKLQVWQETRRLTKSVYIITLKYPEAERFGLISQMRRAAISVGSNIAEGSSRKTSKDQSHFYTIAFSSLLELLSQLIVSYDLGYVDDTHYSELRVSIEQISKQISALSKSILTPNPKHPTLNPKL